jgi:hypothetical protein
LRDNTETLDGSVIALQAALASSLTQSEAILTALNGAGATLIAKVFCGYA